MRATLNRYAVPPVIVVGCSLPLAPDDPLVRQYQWIDFRRQSLGPGTAGRLAGRTALVNLPMTVPASTTLFRLPIYVNLAIFPLESPLPPSPSSQ